MPIDLERAVRRTSATIATIFDVPMSRPTIRFFLVSLLMLLSLAPAFAGASRKPGTRAAKPLG